MADLDLKRGNAVQWSRSLPQARVEELTARYGPEPYRLGRVGEAPEDLHRSLGSPLWTTLAGSQAPTTMVSLALLERAGRTMVN